MKPILLAAAIFLMSLASIRTSAQSSNDVSLAISGLANTGAYLPNHTEARKTEVNVRAMRDFSRTYKNAPSVKWYKSTTGFFATFDENETNTRIVYDNKGNRSYSIISYVPAKLDRNIRRLLSDNYYDATIIGVHQFEFDSKTVYVIKMLDQASNPLTLKVCDGQIEDITSHGKK